MQRLEEEKAHLQLELQARDDLIRVSNNFNFIMIFFFFCVSPNHCSSGRSVSVTQFVLDINYLACQETIYLSKIGNSVGLKFDFRQIMVWCNDFLYALIYDHCYSELTGVHTDA